MTATQKKLSKMLGNKKRRIWTVRSASESGKTYTIIIRRTKTGKNAGKPLVDHPDCMGFRFRRTCHHMVTWYAKRGLKMTIIKNPNARKKK